MTAPTHIADIRDNQAREVYGFRTTAPQPRPTYRKIGRRPDIQRQPR
jgi:hypothetical protein